MGNVAAQPPDAPTMTEDPGCETAAIDDEQEAGQRQEPTSKMSHGIRSR
jgi:hypothetical protein